MRSDELYKFSDGTLTMLLSSLKDITKNIDLTYLPKRRWSNLEKKRVHFMIKDINKLLKERRMMRSLEKFVGVTRWFALIVLSALRRSDNENMVRSSHGIEGIYKDGDRGGKDSGGGGMCLSMGVEKKCGVKDGEKSRDLFGGRLGLGL
ncbi:hypothetical protein Tco_0720457 [Tanacetum coccineum]